jgi:ribosomal protein L27
MGGVSDVAQGLVRVRVRGSKRSHIRTDTCKGDHGLFAIEPGFIQSSEDGDA